MRLKKSKCALMQDSLQYPGSSVLILYCIDAQGVHTTPDKIAAIQKAPILQNVKQLRSFLGLIQYNGKFIANNFMSSLLHPMYHLSKANIKWKCDDQCNFLRGQAKVNGSPDPSSL